MENSISKPCLITLTYSNGFRIAITAVYYIFTRVYANKTWWSGEFLSGKWCKLYLSHGVLIHSLFECNQKGSDKPVKIDKWDGSALKNALDDAAKLVSFVSFNSES